MEIIYATTNDGKKNQVQDFLDYNNYGIKLITLKDIGFDEEIEETGETLEENSEIKAKATKEFCDRNNIKKIIVADDTGLEVDALGGRPGVYSARYAGDHAPQEKNIEKLLNEMKNVKKENRTAKFTCVLTAILPNGEKVVSKGITKGKIAEKCGTMGKLTFGPVFIPDGFDRVMNDLTEEEIGTTHREVAWKKLLNKISNINMWFYYLYSK